MGQNSYIEVYLAFEVKSGAIEKDPVDLKLSRGSIPGEPPSRFIRLAIKRHWNPADIILPDDIETVSGL